MKTKTLFSILTIGLVLNVYGQKPTMELTFTAENNGLYVLLDSILIENLTQGGDTILYTPDTVLSLEYTVGINDKELSDNTLFVSQNYPNPFKGKTEVSLYLPEKEDIKITVQDILGRELAHYKNTLNRGNHSFAFYSAKEKYYMLTVIGKYTSQTIKMLNANSNTTDGGKCKIIYNGYNEVAINFKSQTSINDFIFNLGDQLRYIGYAKTTNEINGSNVIEAIPENNMIYEFEITEGIPCFGIPTITYDDQVYNTVLIGSQCWLKENLNVGIMIGSTQNPSNNSIIEKYCYENNPANCDIYGGLYQWDEMMQYTVTQGVQGICPQGWHIPTNEEWILLGNFLGGDVVAGGKIKETGTTHWNSPNTDATNESGFNSFPGGSRSINGPFYDLGDFAFFWSSTEWDSNHPWSRRLDHTGGYIADANDTSKEHGLSVRCLKD